jgi:hypothetical protein
MDACTGGDMHKAAGLYGACLAARCSLFSLPADRRMASCGPLHHWHACDLLRQDQSDRSWIFQISLHDGCSQKTVLTRLSVARFCPQISQRRPCELWRNWRHEEQVSQHNSSAAGITVNGNPLRTNERTTRAECWPSRLGRRRPRPQARERLAEHSERAPPHIPHTRVQPPLARALRCRREFARRAAVPARRVLALARVEAPPLLQPLVHRRRVELAFVPPAAPAGEAAARPGHVERAARCLHHLLAAPAELQARGAAQHGAQNRADEKRFKLQWVEVCQQFQTPSDSEKCRALQSAGAIALHRQASHQDQCQRMAHVDCSAPWDLPGDCHQNTCHSLGESRETTPQTRTRLATRG